MALGKGNGSISGHPGAITGQDLTPKSPQSDSGPEKRIPLGDPQNFPAQPLQFDLPEEKVRELAEGRVWMGGDAVEHGLCDQIGTLDEAIDLARQEAGLTGRRQVQIVEFPPRPLVEWPSFMPELPSLFGLGTAANGLLLRLAGGPPDEIRHPDPALATTGLAAFDLEYLKRFTSRPGQALMLVEPDLVPEDWRALD